MEKSEHPNWYDMGLGVAMAVSPALLLFLQQSLKVVTTQTVYTMVTANVTNSESKLKECDAGEYLEYFCNLTYDTDRTAQPKGIQYQITSKRIRTANELRLQDKITVWYDPTHPHNIIFTNPNSQCRTLMIPFLTVMYRLSWLLLIVSTMWFGIRCCLSNHIKSRIHHFGWGIIIGTPGFIGFFLFWGWLVGYGWWNRRIVPSPVYSDLSRYDSKRIEVIPKGFEAQTACPIIVHKWLREGDIKTTYFTHGILPTLVAKYTGMVLDGDINADIETDAQAQEKSGENVTLLMEQV